MENPIKSVLRHYGEARKRSERRRSPWNALLLLLCMVTWAETVYLLFRLVWLFHVTIYPEHELKNFGQAGIGFRSGFLSLLMVVSLVPGSGAIAFLLVNALFWLLPWPRKIFEAEARNHPDTNFQSTMRKLWNICIWTFPLGLMCSLLAAYFLKSLH